MGRYRERPVVIEAWSTTDDPASLPSLPAICRGEGCTLIGSPAQLSTPHIHTLEGVHWWSPRDWVIRGVKGEFYFCKPDIFAATYEAVPDGARAVPDATG